VQARESEETMSEEEEKKDRAEEETVPEPEERETDPDTLRDTEAAQEPGSEEEEEDAAFEILVEDTGPCEKKVSVEVPAEVVDEEIEKNLENVKTTMPMRGFRKGRIPKNLLVRRVGKRVREEVRANLVGRALKKALRGEEIKPIAYPEIDEESLSVEDGKPFTFSFTVDVRPEVKIDNYVGLAVEKPAVSVVKKDIDQEVENLRMRFATLEPVEKGKIKRGDHLIVTMEYSLEGRPIRKQENLSMPLPKEKDADIYNVAPWLGELVGKKPGDTVETDYKFPDDFPHKKARGKGGTLRVSVEELKRARLPELDEELFGPLGVENLEALRTKIEEQLTEVRENQAKAEVEKALLDQLLGTVPIELPGRVIEKSLESQLHKAELRMRQLKVPEEEIPERLDKMKEERREEMVREFKAHFITEEIARKEKIYVTEEEVGARVELIAYNYGKWPQQVEQELEEKGQMDELRTTLKEEKVLSFLREKAKITEKKSPAKTGGKTKKKSGGKAAGKATRKSGGTKKKKAAK
jgi:trigger factor